MQTSRKFKATAVGAACAGIGAVAGIAGAAAAPSGSKTVPARPPGAPAWRPGGPPEGHSPGGGAVHAVAEVLNRAGTAFITATEDAGTVKSVSGDQLTIDEAIGKVDYKTVTLTIPTGATVTRNFKPAGLADLKSGDHVHVEQSSDGTTVFADDGTARPGGADRPGPGRGFGPDAPGAEAP